jgi:hypothetical protein
LLLFLLPPLLPALLLVRVLLLLVRVLLLLVRVLLLLVRVLLLLLSLLLLPLLLLHLHIRWWLWLLQALHCHLLTPLLLLAQRHAGLPCCGVLCRRVLLLTAHHKVAEGPLQVWCKQSHSLQQRR